MSCPTVLTKVVIRVKSYCEALLCSVTVKSYFEALF